MKNTLPTTENPWQTLDSETVYENPWIKISHRNVINPSGNAGIYGVVHFKNAAIAIVPLDHHYNTWLVGQFRYTLNEYSWEIPEGGGPKDTPLLESAKRELQEETGIMAETWIEAGKIHTSNSVTDEVGYIFIAKDLTFGEADPEDTEDLFVKKFPFNDVVEMVMQGKITDAIAVSAILKVKLMIDRGKV